MNRLLLLLVLLGLALPAAAEEGAPKKQKLLVLDLKTTGEVDDDTAKLVAELIAVNLSEFEALEVFAGSDVRRMMELEADKLATGCEDDGSCIADIAGALGARYVIYGRLGKLGSRFICTLNLFDADEGKAIERENIKAEDLDKLGDRLEVTLAELVAPLVGSEKVAQSEARPVDKRPKDTGPKLPPPAQDNEAQLALRLGLIVGGFGTFALSYGVAAVLGSLPIGDVDPVQLNYIPVFGPILYAIHPFSGGADAGFGPVCVTCAGVQALGIAAGIAGFFIKDPEPAEAAPVRVQQLPQAPRLVRAEEMAF